jgi:hypothetical protein
LGILTGIGIVLTSLPKKIDKASAINVDGAKITSKLFNASKN